MMTETRTPAEASRAYAAWLERQPLAANTRRAYRVRVAQYCAYLAATPVDAGDPLRDIHAVSYAARDYRTWPQDRAQGQARFGQPQPRRPRPLLPLQPAGGPRGAVMAPRMWARALRHRPSAGHHQQRYD